MSQRPIGQRVLFDSRWIGNHGIGRFARELRARLDVSDLTGAAPVSPRGQLQLEAAMWKLGRKGGTFLSPGFNAPMTRFAPFFLTVHDLIHLHVPEELNGFKRGYYEGVLRPAIRAARRVFTVSEYSRQELLNWSGVSEEQVVTVYNGISEAFTPVGPRHEPGYPYLFYVGNRKPHKNVPRMLQAFALADRRDVKLMLSGSVDQVTARQVADLGLTGRVVYAGELSEADLAAHYRGAIALVMPSLIEGFGLPPLEAMACGTPVICANATSLPEVVGDAALLFDPLEIEDMKNAMTNIVENDEYAGNLRALGFRWTAQYNWSRTANIIQLFINDSSYRNYQGS